MKITILQIGKTKEKAYQEIEGEFLKRLNVFCDLETITVETAHEADPKKENEALQGKLDKYGCNPPKQNDYWIIALDSSGKQVSSEAFAHHLENLRDRSGGRVLFVIGGAKGLSQETLAYANEVLSLSKMTFTHQMVRLFLLEQLYRGFMILGGKKYHY